MTSETRGPPESDEAIRETAVAWLARLRAPDNSDHHAAFEAWYAADPRHADAYDDVLANWDSMGLAARTPAAQAVERQTTRAEPQRPATAFALVAAAIVVALVGTSLSYFRDPRPSSHDARQIASQRGEIRTITLSDGTRATLDTDSVLSISYTAGERRLLLGHGRVRFNVAHDPARPFVVQADGGTILAHGTLFDVDLRGHQLIVSLLRGSVEVRKAAAGTDGKAGKGRMLRPGERLAFDPQTPTGALAPLLSTDTRWPSGMLSFNDTPLADVVAAANRYNSGQIILADPALGTLRFTGTFAATAPDDLARMLAATFHLELARDGRSDIVLSARR